MLPIKETINPPEKELKLSLDYARVIKEKPNMNDPKVREYVINWIQAIYSYQQKKKLPNVVGYLISGGETNKPLIKDIRDNIDPKFKPTPSDAYPQPQVDGQ